MKNKFIIISLLVFLLIPLKIEAKSPTAKFLSDIEIQSNGDIKVKELIKLNGDYNGLSRNLYFRNNDATIYEAPNESALEGNTTLYDGSSLTIDKIGTINDNNSLDFSSFTTEINDYQNVDYATKGESGVYTINHTSSGPELMIYNPSSNKQIFYIEYTIKDVIVIHNDIAEFAYNVLGDGYTENIDDYEVKVTLPEEDSDYRVWLHGPLNGNISRVNDNTALGTYNFLGAYNAVSIRLLFNKDIVSLATKQSGLTAKDKIIAIESKLADEANEERDKLRMQNNIIYGLSIIWLLSCLIFIIMKIRSSKKNKETEFTAKYYREFPSTYGPEVLEYLLNKNITEKSLSATILDLIYKQVLTVEKTADNSKDYKLLLQEYDPAILTEPEKIALDMFLNQIGDSKEVNLSTIKKYCAKESNAKKFLDSYQNYKKEAKTLGKNEEFYLPSKSSNTLLVLLLILSGSILMFITISFEFYFMFLALLFALIILIITLTKIKYYTKKGALDLAKWQAFKNFLNDFSRFNEKELPEVPLWDKYLVYATVLNCADKLSKQMKIKINDFKENNPTFYNNYYDYFYVNSYINSSIYRSIDSGIHTAVASSRSTIASSQSSSGSGFGGGSIGGGGSFGGGGGGGRF